MNEAKLYEKLNNNRVQCRLCHHFCQLKEEQTGICGVRQNIQGSLYSLNNGLLIAEAVDPIEKKPLFHFLPGSTTYSVAAAGCNLRCDNCQNWQISQITKNIQLPNSNIQINFKSQTTSFKQLGYNTTPADIIQRALKSGCRSISYTYTEPTIFFEFALDCMKLARKNGLKNVWVTNGYMSRQCLDEILPYLDAINVDLKFFDENIYRQNCGCQLQPVIDNLRWIFQHSIFNNQYSKLMLEITTLLIPGLTDANNQLEKIAQFIAEELSPEVPWHISKFSPEISYKLSASQETSAELINQAHEQGLSAGLKFIYIGNVLTTDGENTFCPRCRSLVITRHGYQIKRHDQNGHCSNCDYRLPLIVA